MNCGISIVRESMFVKYILMVFFFLHHKKLKIFKNFEKKNHMIAVKMAATW